MTDAAWRRLPGMLTGGHPPQSDWAVHIPGGAAQPREEGPGGSVVPRHALPLSASAHAPFSSGCECPLPAAPETVDVPLVGQIAAGARSSPSHVSRTSCPCPAASSATASGSR
jgi:hypothetical protein